MLARINNGLRRRFLERLRGAAEHHLHPLVRKTQLGNPCVRCGCTEAYLVNTQVKPDFDLNTVEPELRAALLDQKDAICANCGLYHAYARFTPKQVEALNGIGKDAMTTEEVYHSYPVPKEFIDTWYGDSVERQRKRWGGVVQKLGFKPRKILVLRYWFGRHFPMLVETFDAEVSGVDISPICRRHVAEHYPFVRLLDGSINGALSGPFMDEGPFDALIVQHVLVHAVDVCGMMRQFRHLIRNGGFMILYAETKVAPTNPFHKFYPSEYQLMSLVREEFDEAYKLDNDGIIEQDDWRHYTGRADEYVGVVRLN